MVEVTQAASPTSSLISLIKTISGAGLLSIPFAFSTDGLVCGVLIILLAGITSGYGLFLQVYVSKYVPAGHATFFNLCSITYPTLSVVFDIAIATQCFGCAISYLVLIGDLMPTIITSVPYVNLEYYKQFWIIISAFLCVPLSLLKNLDSLKYTSVLGLVAIGYMALLVVVHFLVGDVPDSYRGEITLFPLSATKVFSTFSIVVFAFTGHQNMFSIINEARNKSLSSLSTLVNLAITILAVLFIIIGVAGYLTFGDLVNGNIILLYPSAFSTTVGRFSIVFMVVFSFPLMIHPARISVNNIYFWILVHVLGKTLEEEGHDSEHQESENHDETSPLIPSSKAYIVPFPDSTFYGITALLLVVGYTAAVSIKSFALVLAVVGATGSTAISFILPGLFGYKLIGSESDDPNKLEQTLKTLGLVLSVWGFAVMVVCLYSSLAL